MRRDQGDSGWAKGWIQGLMSGSVTAAADAEHTWSRRLSTALRRITGETPSNTESTVISPS